MVLGMQQAVAVLMLQAFAVERGAAGRRAEQKALRPDVARQPEQVADALRAEHRVVNVKRNHRHAVRRVRRARRNERRHRTGLGDAFFENLSVLLFVVVKQRLAVHRLVKLALGRINADVLEQRVEAERARLVGNDGHDVSAQCPCAAAKR